jgi:hypothetical protein
MLQLGSAGNWPILIFLVAELKSMDDVSAVVVAI